MNRKSYDLQRGIQLTLKILADPDAWCNTSEKIIEIQGRLNSGFSHAEFSCTQPKGLLVKILALSPDQVT